MADPTTTNIVLAVPTRGSDSGTWDTPVNGDMIILDACAGSVTTKSLSNVTVTLSTTESQVNILRFTGVLTATVLVKLGAVIKSWTCENLTTGSFLVQIQGSTGTGNVVALPPGACQIYWDGTNVAFINLGRIGSYFQYAGASFPPWVVGCSVQPMLSCDGSTFSSSIYPLLFAILGTTTLPDLRGRVLINLNGGTGRVTAAVCNIDGDTRFSAGGGQAIALDTSTLPTHSHANSLTDNGHFHSVNDAPAKNGTFSGPGGSGWNGSSSVNTGTATTGITINNVNAGGGAAHVNMQPTFVGGVTMIFAA